MKNVHLTLQGKGGVGKSLVTSLVAQYHQEKGRETVNLDTDPVNSSFESYAALNVRHIDLLDSEQKLNTRNFDQLMEAVLTEDADFIVDNGASSFLPLSGYMVENEVPQLIAGAGKQLVIHTVVTGGQALRETLSGLARLAEQMPPEARIIVWLNEFFGDIEANGKTFEEMRAYTDNRERISGLVKLTKLSGDTFAKDFAMMLDRKLTFSEATASPDFGLMSKQRLGMVKKAIWQQLDTVL
ncbi:conjugal transfer protein TraL [Sphingomonas sp. ABOLF]|uniref:nucleotide-binding protein n=1 Tax=Sphingomonas sp. ABOLF TaxID=1985879 RepID=UPI000F7F166C|nr:conjugal transfer protein TraL [Sphingomonas sp. ABOLF]RSV12409.1 conjugal transfer protein TraL [Sphingomonas sp. ABOLF]